MISRNHLAVISLSVATTFASSCAAMEQTEFAACGHKVHDSAELRAQAGARIFWQDSKAANRHA